MLCVILVFDLSGVFFNDGLAEAVRRIHEKFGLDEQDVEDALNGPFAKEYRKGNEPPAEFWMRVKERFGLADIEKFKKLFFSSYHPHQKTVDLISRLRAKNIRCGFLSNSPEDRVKYLDERHHFVDLFDFGAFSYEAHSWKPEKEIYEFLINKEDLNPAEITYIDDKKKNLPPAQDLGMNTLLFTSVEQLEKDLPIRASISSGSSS